MQSIGRQCLARVGADESGTACYQDRLLLLAGGFGLARMTCYHSTMLTAVGCQAQTESR